MAAIQDMAETVTSIREGCLALTPKVGTGS